MSTADETQLSRRRLFPLLGLGLGAGLVTGLQKTRSPIVHAATNVAFPKGAVIRTLLKDVPPEDLAGGATLFHEHISISDPPPAWLPPRKNAPPPAYAANIDLMVNEIKALKTDGVSCIVDASTIGLGRNMEHLKAIATRSGFPIVVAGGYYLHAAYPPEIAQDTEDQIVETMLRDAAAERWGAMGEIGVSQHPMFPDEQKVLRAVCKVNLQTGLPVFTHNPHTGCGACGVEQMDVIESMGVDPKHVCIGHLSDITDDPKAETHKAIAKRGAFLGFDTVGRRLTQPDSKKLEMLLAVLDAGYEDHVLLGSDFATEDELKANHGPGLDAALIVFVPKMRYAGVKEATIHKILVDNPRRFLAFVPKKGNR